MTGHPLDDREPMPLWATWEERKMAGYTYPDRHPPGAHWSTDVGWQILDVLPVGRLDDVERAFICGMIASALVKCAETGAPIAPLEKLSVKFR